MPDDVRAAVHLTGALAVAVQTAVLHDVPELACVRLLRALYREATAGRRPPPKKRLTRKEK